MPPRVCEQPGFGGRLFAVVETVRKQIFLVFYHFINTFGAGPISVGEVLKSEVVASKCCLEPSGPINEKQRFIDVVFVFEFMQKSLGKRVRRAGNRRI